MRRLAELDVYIGYGGSKISVLEYVVQGGQLMVQDCHEDHKRAGGVK